MNLDQSHYTGFVKAALENGLSIPQASAMYKEAAGGAGEAMAKMIIGARNAPVPGWAMGPRLPAGWTPPTAGAKELPGLMSGAAGASVGASKPILGPQVPMPAEPAAAGPGAIQKLMQMLSGSPGKVGLGAGALAGGGFGYAKGMESMADDIAAQQVATAGMPANHNPAALKSMVAAKGEAKPATPAAGMPDWAKYLGIGAGAGGLGLAGGAMMNKDEERKKQELTLNV